MANEMERQLEEFEAILSSDDWPTTFTHQQQQQQAPPPLQRAYQPPNGIQNSLGSTIMRAARPPASSFRPLVQQQQPPLRAFAPAQQQVQQVEPSANRSVQYQQQNGPLLHQHEYSSNPTQLYEIEHDGRKVLCYMTPSGLQEAFPSQDPSSPSPAMHAPIPFRPPHVARLQEAMYPEYGDDHYGTPSRSRSSKKRTASNDHSERMDKRVKREMKDMQKMIEMQQWQIEQMRTQFASSSNGHAHTSSPRQARGTRSPTPVVVNPHNLHSDNAGPSSDRVTTLNGFGQVENGLPAQRRQPLQTTHHNRAEPQLQQTSGPLEFEITSGEAVLINGKKFPPQPTLPLEGTIVPAFTSKQGMGMTGTNVLPDQYRSLFRFPTFNQVQTRCFPLLWLLDDNVVVSAPTGAGKTVLFEIAMIKALQADREAQAVYIAPTKSLCGERYNDWNHRLRPIFKTGKRSHTSPVVVELTGDSSLEALNQAKEARLIITTPEKWDSVTRRETGKRQWFHDVTLFCIDEVHLLAEERGATLEVIMSRMKSLGTSMRMIAVSATVPNIEDVALWMGPGSHVPKVPGEPRKMAHVMKFTDAFRTCPLQKLVVGYPKSQNDNQFDSTLNFKLLDLIVAHSKNKPTLIFCNTRKGCLTAAEKLCAQYDAQTQSKDVAPWPRPVNDRHDYTDSAINNLARNGIGIHHGGVAWGDRKAIEQRFIDGKLRVICTTSTFAQGVNLPAHLVIIKGTTIWDSETGRHMPYSDLDVIQMMGRAGRPQFDSTGTAIIMCKDEDKAYYEDLGSSNRPLESSLHKTLTEHINAEISTKTIKTRADALKWVQDSFLYVRIKSNPNHYREVIATDPGASLEELAEEEMLNEIDVKPEHRLEQLVDQAIDSLENEGLLENIDNTVETTVYGDLLCAFNVRYHTFLLLKSMPRGIGVAELLSYISRAEEFKDIRFRAGEKQAYANLNNRDEVKYPLDLVKDTSDKVNLLLQLKLSRMDMDTLKSSNANPAAEANLVLTHATRISLCLVDLANEKQDVKTAKASMQLMKALQMKSWEDPVGILMQINRVGAVGAQNLVEAGLDTIERVANATEARIADCTNQSAARFVLQQAQKMPKFKIDLKIIKEKKRDDGLAVTLEATLGLRSKLTLPENSQIVNKKLPKAKICIAIMTNDDEWISWDRMQLSKLLARDKQEYVFTKHIMIYRPSQKIEATVTCLTIGGLNATAVIKPQLPAVEFSTTWDINRRAAMKKLLEEEEVRTRESSIFNHTRNLNSPAEASTSAAAKKSGPKRMANGRYKSLHTCQEDGKHCKHDCCARGLLKPPRKRSESAEPNGYDSSSDEDTRRAKKQAAKKKKATTAKSLAGPAIDRGAEDSDVDDFALPKKGKRSIGSSQNPSKADKDKLRLSLSPLPEDFNEADLDFDDTSSLPDLSEAARMPERPKPAPKAKKPAVISPDTSPKSKKTQKKSKKQKDRDTENKASAKAHNSDSGSEIEDPWSDSDQDEDSFKLPPPLFKHNRVDGLNDLLSPQRTAQPAQVQRQRSLSLSISPPKTSKKKSKTKTVEKMPLRIESSVEDIAEEVRNLDDNHNRAVESDKEESEYGREDDPEPVASEAEEDNAQEERGNTSDEGEGDPLGFYDEIVIEDADREWEGMK